MNFAFDVYDFKGNGTIDAFYVGDVLRACNLNPTLKAIEELGGTEAEGEASISLEAFFPKFKAAKEAPKGGFHDYVEILKLYDKNADDTIQGNDLFKLLTNLGEKLTKEEAKILMNELCEPEDEDGFMQFKRKNTFSAFDPKVANYSWALVQNQIIALPSFPGEDVRCREVETFQGTKTTRTTAYYHILCP